MKMYTGDLKPDLKVTLSDGDPDGWVDVSSANAVRIIGRRGSEVVFDRAPDTTLVVDDTSVLTMEWQAGDTDEAGRIQIEVEVMWPPDLPQTFRPDGGVDIVTDFDLADTTP